MFPFSSCLLTDFFTTNLEQIPSPIPNTRNVVVKQPVGKLRATFEGIQLMIYNS